MVLSVSMGDYDILDVIKVFGCQQKLMQLFVDVIYFVEFALVPYVK